MYVGGFCEYSSHILTMLRKLNISFPETKCAGEWVLDSFEIPEEYDDLFIYTPGNAATCGYLKLSDLGKEKYNELTQQK